MYPHERSLVKRLAGKPFALVGVNSDTERDQIREIMKKEEISWPSFWNGGGTDGPISSEWNVHGWPTIYVFDKDGVIRFKNKREKELDACVDKLLAEMESPAVH